MLGGESTAGHLIAAGRRSDGQADPGVRSTADAGLTRAPDAVTWGALPGGASPGEFLAGVRAAEALGFDSVWVGDHVLWHVFWPEPLSMLGAASAVTERVGLGSGVLLAALRRPAPLAKQTATLQWLSGGRFHLGVGAGGEFAGEFEASGVPLSRRGAALDQTLEALRALWTGAPVTLHNDVVQLDDAVLDVVPDPAIPIWVGGRSPGAQRRAARYGDAWMPFVVTPERFREGWAAVRAQAEAFDRDPDQLLPALQLWCQFDDDLTVPCPRSPPASSRPIGRPSSALSAIPSTVMPRCGQSGSASSPRPASVTSTWSSPAGIASRNSPGSARRWCRRSPGACRAADAALTRP